MLVNSKCTGWLAMFNRCLVLKARLTNMEAKQLLLFILFNLPPPENKALLRAY